MDRYFLKANVTNQEDGFIRLKIKESGIVHKLTLIEEGVTLKNWPRNPYLKLSYMVDSTQKMCSL